MKFIEVVAMMRAAAEETMPYQFWRSLRAWSSSQPSSMLQDARFSLSITPVGS